MRSVQSAAAFWALRVSLLPAPALPPWPPMHSMEGLTKCMATTAASLFASRCSEACVCVCVCSCARAQSYWHQRRSVPE